eukprot:14649368-Alexandrium_andersonii.AAC.1
MQGCGPTPSSAPPAPTRRPGACRAARWSWGCPLCRWRPRSRPACRWRAIEAAGGGPWRSWRSW